VYKDVHAGGLQSDDVRRADFEMALSDGGGWQHIPVDWGRGAGDYNDVLFDEDGNLYLITYNGRMRSGESITGIWVRRSTDGGQTFEEVQLTNRAAPEGPDAVIDDEGRLHIIYYEADRGFPRLATLSDASNFESVSEGWTLGDIGDSQYDEGYRPSIAVGPSGHVAVAYYRCNRAAAGLGDCDPNEDGLVFAWEDEGEWTQEVVDAGDLGLCGESPSLGFDDAGRAVVAYRCEIETDEGTFDHVKFARRKALP
jgi:hypothetical protein